MNSQSSKSHIQNGRKFHCILLFLTTLSPQYGVAEVQRQWLNFWFPFSVQGKKNKPGWRLFAMFCHVRGIFNLYLFCLTLSSERNGNMLWISGWKSQRQWQLLWCMKTAGELQMCRFLGVNDYRQRNH